MPEDPIDQDPKMKFLVRAKQQPYEWFGLQAANCLLPSRLATRNSLIVPRSLCHHRQIPRTPEPYPRTPRRSQQPNRSRWGSLKSIFKQENTFL